MPNQKNLTKTVILITILIFLGIGGILAYRFLPFFKKENLSFKGTENLLFKEAMLAEVPEGLDKNNISVYFSPDGKRAVYTACNKDECSVNIDNLKGKLYSYIDQEQFSPDGTKFAYIAEDEDNSFAVLDNKESKAYYDVDNLIFSPDSKKLVYTAFDMDDNLFIVTNGKEEKKDYDNIYDPIFSPDSKKFAYVAKINEKYSVVANNKEGKYYDSIADNLIFSSNSEHTVYWAYELSGRILLILDGQEELLNYDSIDFLTFSPNSEKIAFVGINGLEKDSKVFVVEKDIQSKEEKIIPVIDCQSKNDCTRAHILQLHFSSDGEQIAYIIETVKEINDGGNRKINIEQFVGLNDKEKKHYKFIDPDSLIFSPDGKKLSYVATMGQAKESFVVINDQEEKKYSIYYGQETIIFSPDSQHIAYSIYKKDNSDYNEFVILDGKEIGHYDSVDKITFSSDSQQLGIGAEIGREIWWKVVKAE